MRTALLSALLFACRCESDPADAWRFFYQPMRADFRPSQHPFAVGATCEIIVDRVVRTSPVHGSATEDIPFDSVASSDPGVISARLLDEPGHFEIAAHRPGRASVTLASAGAARTLELSVEEPRAIELRLSQFGQPEPASPRFGPGEVITVYAQTKTGMSVPLAACGLRPWRVEPEDALSFRGSITTWGPHPSLSAGVAEQARYEVATPHAEVRVVPELGGDPIVFATDAPPHVEVPYPR